MAEMTDGEKVAQARRIVVAAKGAYVIANTFEGVSSEDRLVLCADLMGHALNQLWELLIPASGPDGKLQSADQDVADAIRIGVVAKGGAVSYADLHALMARVVVGGS